MSVCLAEKLCSFAVNWESDLQCRRGPNAVQNTLKPTSHSYPRKTTRGPSPCLQSINKPTTTLHVTILYVDRLIMAFVCPLRIKLATTLWALDFVQLAGPNISFFITTTSCSNAVFMLRIPYEVAPVNQSMFFNRISA